MKKSPLFLITQKVLNNYEQQKYNQQWNEEAIIDRWKFFFTELEELFQIDFSEIKENHNLN